MTFYVHQLRFLYLMKHLTQNLFLCLILTFSIFQKVHSNPLLLKEIERLEKLIQILESKNDSLFQNQNLREIKKNLSEATKNYQKKRLNLALKMTSEAKEKTFLIFENIYGKGTSETLEKFSQTEYLFERIRPEIRKSHILESKNVFIQANKKLDSARFEIENTNFKIAKRLTEKANLLAKSAYKISKSDFTRLADDETYTFISMTDEFVRISKELIPSHLQKTAEDLQKDAWEKYAEKDFESAMKLSKSVRLILRSNIKESTEPNNLNKEFVKKLLFTTEQRFKEMRKDLNSKSLRKSEKEVFRKISIHLRKANIAFNNGNLGRALIELKICNNLKDEFGKD